MRNLSALVVTVVLLAGGCGGDDDAAAGAERPTVVATTSVLADVVANVVGDAADVEVVIPAGTDPHDFRPDARQIAALRGADLVVANGLRLEEGLLDALDDAAGAGVPVLELADQLDPLPFLGEERHDGDDHDGDDPHFWQDPVRMAQAVGLIGDRLERELPGGAWRAGAEAYAARVLAVHDEVAARYAAIPPGRRHLVTNHDAFGYLAARYGLEVVATVLPGGSTLAAASAADREALVRALAAEEVPVVFTENVVPDDLARSISEAVGREVTLVALVSDALDDDAPTYVDLVRANADRVTAALGA